MQQPNLQRIKTLLKDIEASVEKYKTTNSEIARLAALKKSLKLSSALESPKAAIIKLFFSPTKVMVIKATHDLSLFTALVKSKKAVSPQDLAEETGGHPLLIERLMRVVASIDFVEQQGNDKYSSNRLSEEMVNKKSTAFDDFGPAVFKTPDFFRETNYQNPEDHSTGPMQYTYNSQLTVFEWLAANPGAHNLFHAYVESFRDGQHFWVDWYPVQERILDSYIGTSDDPLIVDVAGGSGRDILAFQRRFPHAEGRLILEDLPAVVNDDHFRGQALEKVAYDVFTPQPIQGARVYYLKFTLHEFSDDNCKRILKNIAQTMTKGYSKLLIEEFFPSQQDTNSFHAMVDMLLIWVKILQSAGPTLNRFWYFKTEGPGILEAEL
ncbi:S-adenosyl-L-methionine-dependent methyltransferase [Aspergillus bertholletiae]|uniref:S-adenosyl-L-methionine-dependent methyltransferase n=1 Tax=Aspergillus bertholletiae TaxID=1226010 RepID=A0A5N7B0C2_9EURO|nr:S-adenosyl-L-methionine-dependent methyltransferase [Aspergillus bertholletiae]